MNNTFSHFAAYDYMINILEALKEGKDIQYRDENTDEWILHDINELPRFAYYEYRIKPVAFKYRVALFKNGNFYPMLITNDEVAEAVEKDDNTFVKWITDWVEYTIENQNT